MAKKHSAPTKLSDLRPDQKNANKGTPRGAAMLERSLQQYGAGRSVLADKHLNVMAGNKTVEAAASIGLDDVIVVQTDGKQLVVVQRTDLDLEKDPAARELAIADNRAGEVGLAWDADVLAQMQEDGVELEQFFRDQELDKILSESGGPDGDELIDEMALQPFEEYDYILVVCKTSPDWQGLCNALDIKREAVTLGKTRKVGLGRVIDGGALLKRLQTT